jgi:hypothetical protein
MFSSPGQRSALFKVIKTLLARVVERMNWLQVARILVSSFCDNRHSLKVPYEKAARFGQACNHGGRWTDA